MRGSDGSAGRAALKPWVEGLTVLQRSSGLENAASCVITTEIFDRWATPHSGIGSKEEEFYMIPKVGR